MDIYDFAESIQTKQDFDEFLKMLNRDFISNKSEWENDTLGRYLDSMYGFSISMDGYYQNKKELVDLNTPTWNMVAKLLLAAKIYE